MCYFACYVHRAGAHKLVKKKYYAYIISYRTLTIGEFFMYYDVPEGLGLRKIAAGWFDNLDSAENLMNANDSMDPAALRILGMYNRARMPHDNFKYKPAPEDPRKVFSQRLGRYMLSRRRQQDQRWILNPKGVNRATSPQPAARQPAGNKPGLKEQLFRLGAGATIGGLLGSPMMSSRVQQLSKGNRGGSK
jgi:hypothetical protein